MSDFVSWLITVSDGNDICRCAIRINRMDIDSDVLAYYMESESREYIHKLLPLHIKSRGNVVNVEDISDVIIVKDLHYDKP